MLPASYYQFAAKLAHSSGDIIRSYYGKGVSVDRKRDDSPVTVADREAESRMRDLIRIAFPSHGIIGEEFGNENPHAEFVWLLDPIDGTHSFVAGIPLFGTLIALLQQGQPVLGVIHQPILQEMVIGDGQVTKLNGKPVHMRANDDLSKALMLCTYATARVEKHQNGAGFDKLMRSVAQFRTWGDAYGYLMLATGRADVMVDPIMNPWDVGPLRPIIEGAGGKITNWQGESVIGANSVVASSPLLHKKIIQILNETEE
ncbi:MAG: histidinol-phosphatase [Bacteroidetes Order II. Incertae sedis bacterium]|nr:histidinol-phosphatase [Bacteroidetes Order II. bacterium]